MKESSSVLIFLDDSDTPLASVSAPVNLELDTRKLSDGKHVLKIISQGPDDREGLKEIHFEVRNGPAIVVEGISEDEIVDGVVPLMINAYSKAGQETFFIQGSESPQSIPTWIWVFIIGFISWALFYGFSYFNSN